MFNQKYIILFINRNRFQLFGGTISGVVSIDIPETLLFDLDIVSKDGFYSLIKLWVKQYTLTGSQLIIILSQSSYFEKVFSLKEQSQIESDVLKFFDMVPYDSIWTKVYTIEKGKRAVAINKVLYDTIHQGFSLQGVPIKALIPAFALGDMSAKQSLDTGVTEYITKNLETLMKQSLLDPQELSAFVPQQKNEETIGAPKQKSQLPLLLGIFGFFILILIVVVALQYR